MQPTVRERRTVRWPRQRVHKETLAAAEATPLAAESTNPIERRQTPLRRLIGLCRPYQPWLVGGSFCLVIAGALGLVLPWVVRGLIDNVLGAGGMGALWQALVALVAIAVTQAIFTFGQGFLLAYAGERLVADLRSRLYRHLQRLSVGFFDGRRVGELLSRLTNDVAAVQQAITNGLFSSLQRLILLIGAACLLVATEWRLAAVALTTVPPIVIASAYFGRRLQRLTNEAQAELGSTTAVLEETIAGARTVRAFAQEEYEIGRYNRGVGRAFGAAMRRARLRAGFVPLITLCALLGVIGVLVLGAQQVGSGTMTPGALVSAILYITLMASSVGALTGAYAQLCEAGGAAERLFELLDTTPDIIDAPDARPLPAILDGRVRFDRLSFSYGDQPAAPMVLRDLSLEIAPGERLAIVGPSGAGKSTLVNLLLRFYDPSSGSLAVDGHDLREVQLNSLRDRLGVVPQEPVLFSGTVAENIAYGRQEATQEQIAAAATAANAHAFITELPEGYDTVVGERGARLSGGQRQRIAIARAILKDPRILILDEATSSLDTTSEAIVREALERLMQGRTTIVIAHRLSTVESADRIVVLDRGRIAEQGTHTALLARNGLYHRLYTSASDRGDGTIAAK